MSSVKIEDKRWREVRARISKLAAKQRRVRVGVLGADGGWFGDTSLVEVAGYLEYGAPRANIPPRPFLRSTLRDRRDDIMKRTNQLAASVLRGTMSVDRALGLLGQYVTSQVKKTITSGDGVPPPLTAETIQKKGSTRPLVDEGRLLNSINYRIE